MKLFTYIIIFLLLSCTQSIQLTKCTIKQIKGEKICPAIATICELEIYFLNNPNLLPDNLREEEARNLQIIRKYKTKILSKSKQLLEIYGNMLTLEEKDEQPRFSNAPIHNEQINEIQVIFEDISKKIIPLILKAQSANIKENMIIKFVSAIFEFKAKKKTNIRECDNYLCVLGVDHGSNLEPIINSVEKNLNKIKKCNNIPV